MQEASSMPDPQLNEVIHCYNSVLSYPDIRDPLSLRYPVTTIYSK